MEIEYCHFKGNPLDANTLDDTTAPLLLQQYVDILFGTQSLGQPLYLRIELLRSESLSIVSLLALWRQK